MMSDPKTLLVSIAAMLLVTGLKPAETKAQGVPGISARPSGLCTGSRVSVLDPADTLNWLLSHEAEHSQSSKKISVAPELAQQTQTL